MKYIKYLLLLGLIFLSACGQEEQKVEEALKSNEIYYYYANSALTNIVREKGSINEMLGVETLAENIMKELIECDADGEKQSPIPKGMIYGNCEYDESQKRLMITFSVMYENIGSDELVFAKSCIVNSLLQLKDVDMISISLVDALNSNSETAVSTELYGEDSFVMSFNDNNGYAQKGNIILYFANEEGTALKEYHKSIEITNNMSLAEIVVESLITGPKQEGFQATIPKETTIRNILIKDGICYVDFSEEFYDTDNPMKNDLIVYSIVNSLAELPTVSKVQFLKDGEKQDFYRETMPFDGLFERNLDLIEHEGM